MTTSRPYGGRYRELAAQNLTVGKFGSAHLCGPGETILVTGTRLGQAAADDGST